MGKLMKIAQEIILSIKKDASVDPHTSYRLYFAEVIMGRNILVWIPFFYWGINLLNSFRGLSKSSQQRKLDAYAAMVSE